MKRYPILVRSMVFMWALSLMLLACVPPKPTKVGITGLWVEYKTVGESIPDCGTFEFFEDGRFAAKDIPREYFVPGFYDSYSPERLDAHGSWELDTSSNGPFAVHRIRLHFDSSGMFPTDFDGIFYIPIGGDLLQAGVDDYVLFKKGERCE